MNIELDHKYTLSEGFRFLTGSQALVRIPIVQKRRDKKKNINSAGYISGYRGSPLGTYDKQVVQAKKYLEKHNVYFQPGLNEELAATSLWGTQQSNFYGEGKFDGVFGVWYGKGPGVDRSGDALKHANLPSAMWRARSLLTDAILFGRSRNIFVAFRCLKSVSAISTRTSSCSS